MEVPDLAWLLRAKDLMDREYERPLDVAQVAAAAHMSSRTSPTRSAASSASRRAPT